MVVSNRVVFWDGDSFIIVSKHCDKEQAKRILAALAEADLDYAAIEDGCAAPVKEAEETIPEIPEEEKQPPVIQSGRYSGMTPEEVLGRDKDKGFANLAYLKSRLADPVLIAEIERCLSGYFKSRFGGGRDPFERCTTFTKEHCACFFKYFGSVLTEEDRKNVSDQAGAISFDAFLSEASLEQLQSLIASTINKYAA